MKEEKSKKRLTNENNGQNYHDKERTQNSV